MPTPSIQILRTDAQQVLNLDSISAVRSVVAASLANANSGTPLNPNLTTQQLWNEFYQIVTQPKSDIESIIANQLMKFLYAPPAPGGAGADKQVIFNDGGVLAGDPGLTFDKVTNALTITGDLTVDTNVLKVDTTNNRVGIGTTSPDATLDVTSAGTASTYTVSAVIQDGTYPASGYPTLEFNGFIGGNGYRSGIGSIGGQQLAFYTPSTFGVAPTERYRIASDGVATWSNVGGFAGTAMTLNATGLGVGASPLGKFDVYNTGSDTTVFIRSDTTRLGQIVFRDNADAGNQGLVRYDHTNDRLSFTANGGENLYLLSTGDLSVQTGNVVMATSGKGIDFSANNPDPAGRTSELLNDYEEGTFTATLKGATTDPTTPVTATGRYTKIGREVTVQVFFVNKDTTGASGRIQIAGLPFANNSSIEAVGLAAFYDMATFTGSPFAQFGQSATQIEVYSSVSNSAWQPVTHNAGTNKFMWINLTYTV